MSTNMDKICNGITHPMLPKVTGEPTYKDIKALHILLKSNISSTHSTVGGGACGLLRLTLNALTYFNVTSVAFVLPISPGNTPGYPANATARQILFALATISLTSIHCANWSLQQK